MSIMHILAEGSCEDALTDIHIPIVHCYCKGHWTDTGRFMLCAPLDDPGLQHHLAQVVCAPDTIYVQRVWQAVDRIPLVVAVCQPLLQEVAVGWDRGAGLIFVDPGVDCSCAPVLL